MAQSSCDVGSERLAIVDVEKYGRNVLCAEDFSTPYYSDIPLIPLSRKVDLNQRVEAEASMQKILDGGYLALLPLKKVDVNALFDFNDLVFNSGCKSYTYTMELSHCRSCRSISHGFLSTCPKCGADRPTHLGRATALLQPTAMWPQSKAKSSVNWIYHRL